eukprot:213426-Hanusia_phi.AAC.1
MGPASVSDRMTRRRGPARGRDGGRAHPSHRGGQAGLARPVLCDGTFSDPVRSLLLLSPAAAKAFQVSGSARRTRASGPQLPPRAARRNLVAASLSLPGGWFRVLRAVAPQGPCAARRTLPLSPGPCQGLARRPGGTAVPGQFNGCRAFGHGHWPSL